MNGLNILLEHLINHQIQGVSYKVLVTVFYPL